MKRFALVAVVALALTGCASQTPPVSEKVQQYYDQNVANAKAGPPTSAPMPKVAFLGDSYTYGNGAGSPAARWSTRTALTMGWDEINAGVSGTGYSNGGTNAGGKPYTDRVADIVSQRPAIVIVSGGRNDLVQKDARALDAAVTKTFADLRAGLPTAKIVALSPVWDDDQPPTQLPALGETVRAAVTTVGGTYLDIGEPLVGHPEAMSKDGVHPNDAGYKLLADATVEALTAAGIQS